MNEDKFNLIHGEDTNGRLNTSVKKIPNKFITSDIFWGFETSPGDRPAEPFMPNRYAPTVRNIKNVSLFEKGIVIPTGTIISAIPLMNQEYYTSGSPTLFDGVGGADTDVASGQIGLGIGYDGSLLQENMDDMIDGYDIIRLVGTIANGGEAVTDPYVQYDVDRGLVGIDGQLVTTSDTFARGANIPIGFTTEDIYLFDQGGKLNYSEIKWNRFSSFATDYFVEMPYCADNTLLRDGSSFGGGADATAEAGYAAAKALGMPFYWTNSISEMIIGNFAQSDRNGKWRAQYLTSGAAGKKPVDGVKDSQTVGKLVSFTNKFPVDLENFVETWNTTKTGGTATYGLEYRLWCFMTAVLGASDYATIKSALNSGKFGIARINVHTS